MKDKNKIYISLVILIIFSILFIMLNIIHEVRMNNTLDFIECVSIHDISNVKLCKNTFIPPIEVILLAISMLFILISLFYIIFKIGSIKKE